MGGDILINKDSKEYGIIVTTLMAIGFLVMIGLSLKNLDIESETQTSYMPEEKRVLVVGEPKYVEYEDIKADDKYIKKDNNSKYSQISIKNISDKTLYNIWIDLKQQEMNEKGSFLSPTYTLTTSLKPGESAILSFQHNDLKENQELKIESYTYMDGQGKLFKVNNIEPSNKSEQGVYVETNKKDYKYENITKEIDRITIVDTREVEVNGKKYLNIDIKNNSELELRDVNLNFKQYYKNIVVGGKSQDIGYTLKPKEKATIEVEVKNGLKLELEEYGYSITEKNDNEIYDRYYKVFIDEGKYDLREYQSIEERNRRNFIFSTISFVWITIAGILDMISNRIEKKIKLEENEVYHDRAKVIKRIRTLMLIIYIGFTLYFLWYDKL